MTNELKVEDAINELLDIGSTYFGVGESTDSIINLIKQQQSDTDTLSSNLHIAETAVFEQMIEIGNLTIEIDVLKNQIKTESKSQQSSIEILESAIREFNDVDSNYDPEDIEHLEACTKLRNLMK